MKKLILASVLVSLVALGAFADEARMLRFPDIHNGQVVFVYGGDLWTVAASGGVARRLTTHEGYEFAPKYSPDGKTIAFTGNYDGNADVFIIPAEGGVPKRLTYHPIGDEVLGWHPDGKRVLFRSIRTSELANFARHHLVSVEGGYPELLPMPTAELGSFNDDGTKVAYNRMSRERRTWKRYRGGRVQEVWVYDLKNNTSENITNNPATDNFPMWQGDKIYFLSDREESMKLNLYSYDINTKAVEKLTNFTEYDVKEPSIGPGAIVFENGGYLYTLDLNTKKTAKVNVELFDDGLQVRPEIKNVQRYIHNFSISPSGARALFEARGDIFSVPAEKGEIRNLTQTPGIREREPVWSPDGKWIAYFGDETGEYQIYVMKADGSGEVKQVTKGLKTYFNGLDWSPDSKKIMYSDCTNTLYYIVVGAEEPVKIYHDHDNGSGNFVGGTWSPKSDWIAYSKNDKSGFRSIYLYNLKDSKEYRITSNLTSDSSPSFDPEGKYLYWVANREMNFGFDAFEWNYFHFSPSKLVVATLRKDLENPFAPESDEEKVKEEPKAEEKKAEAKPDEKKAEPKADEKKAEDEGLKIDIEGLEARMVDIPVPDGRYAILSGVKGGLVYYSLPSFDGNGGASLNFFDMKSRESKPIISGVGGATISNDGQKILYASRGSFFVIAARPGQKPGDGRLNLSNMDMLVDYRAEWNQMFNEAWRIHREFFYDANLHGVDWQAMHDRYAALLPYLAHRDDFRYLLGELVSELATGHTYVRGGDYPDVNQEDTGLLACDFVADKDKGYFKISKIFLGQSWDPARRSPLVQPGLDINEGDYIFAINGKDLKYPDNPLSLLVNTAGKAITIKVGKEADPAKAKEYTVVPVARDVDFRYIDWVMSNIAKVEKATGAKIGYIHVPDTAVGGIEWFTRLFNAQREKDGLIVDARFNRGGWMPSLFMERLTRGFAGSMYNRYSNGFHSHQSGHIGPKVCITNSWAGSGGDAFPFFFHQLGIGPTVGTRTWGGLVGYSGTPIQMDNSGITVPDIAFVNVKGEWDVENVGYTPDYVVDNLPHELAAGKDAQLEKAIELVLQMVKEKGKIIPDYPTKFPVR